MASRKSSVDLGKELTCSICTELLYQPLTLLDCLHTYCGACLKEWFRFQAAKAARAPTPPTPDTVIFSCPSCRSRVRDTRHNATVVTLLDMYTAANPGRGRSDADKEEAAAKYKPGDQVLPKVHVRERTAEERQADEEDQRLMEEVRQLSLREAVAGHPQPSRPRHASQPRHGGDSRSSGDERRRPSRDHNHNTGRSESSHHRAREESRQRRGTENGGRGRDHHLTTTDGHRRPSHSHSRQVEHQSSLRSLIGSHMSDRDIEREIEDFARQIQDEGLLDGLDLDNIDLSRDDELSRRITDAYRRRQRERPRHDPSRRSNASARSSAARPVDSAGQDPRLRMTSRPQSRARAHSRSTSVVEGAEGRSRPPLSTSANLEVRHPEGRTRRRTTSDARSSTAPVPAPLFSTDTPARPAAQSQTDLTLRSEVSSPTPILSGHVRPGRSSSLDAVPGVTQAIEPPTIPSSRSNNSSFANRVPQLIAPLSVSGNANPSATSASSAATNRLPPIRPLRLARPPDLVLGNANNLAPNSSPSPASRGQQQLRSQQLHEEPLIACARCEKPHIEYELHYNCKACNDGQWNVCQDCYRAGKGCLYWFGFGQAAWKKWEKRRQGDASSPAPHTLTAARYLRPSSTSTNHENGRTMTSDDPKSRLQTGTFCAKCLVWTNECYWRCDVCNEGEWGFCNDCVNQGKSCSHKLLPLAHETTTSTSQTPSRSPRSPSRPPAASMLSGPQTAGIGPFKPLTFNTRCDICQDAIPPSKARFHCFNCTSALVPDASLGDYDICTPCYAKLEAQGRISKENGQFGWRRCLSGHRMVVVGFIEGKVGQWRYIEQDLIGGRALRSEPVERGSEHPGLEKWSWHQDGDKVERLVTEDVSQSAPSTLGSTITTSSHSQQSFPPDGGAGRWARAMWAWYPKVGADDELLFPRGADIKEIRDINGDWFFGSYMGEKGLFPAPYVQGYLAS